VRRRRDEARPADVRLPARSAETEPRGRLAGAPGGTGSGTRRRPDIGEDPKTMFSKGAGHTRGRVSWPTRDVLAKRRRGHDARQENPTSRTSLQRALPLGLRGDASGDAVAATGRGRSVAPRGGAAQNCHCAGARGSGGGTTRGGVQPAGGGSWAGAARPTRGAHGSVLARPWSVDVEVDTTGAWSRLVAARFLRASRRPLRSAPISQGRFSSTRSMRIPWPCERRHAVVHQENTHIG